MAAPDQPTLLSGRSTAGPVADDGHYAGDVVGARYGLPGGGLHVYFTGDLLHPPMVPDMAMWANGRLWKQGAATHTLAIGELAGLKPGEHVLDVGCGLGGPARLLAQHFDVSVTSLTNSPAHAQACRELNARSAASRARITVVLADGQDEVPAGPFDAALCINMLYQVPDHRALFSRIFDSLSPTGRFVIDDWMLTSRAVPADINALAAHFSYSNFARIEKIEDDLMAAGFPPGEVALDFGHVGRGPMAKHFESQVQSFFGPQVISDWPGDPQSHPGQAAYGKLMIEQFVQAVKLTLELYLDRHMTYRRLLLRKTG